MAYIGEHRKALEWAISAGHLTERDQDRFCEDVDRAWREGLRRGLAGQRRFMPADLLSQYAAPFLSFERLVPAGERRTVCLLTQGYPPSSIVGIARYVRQLARGMAASGHHIHVLTCGHAGDTVDFEDGIWVHRITPKSHPLPSIMPVPEHIWNYSATMLAEVRKIALSRPVDAVIAPIWDCEGLGFLLDGKFTLVISLQTTLKHWLESNQYRTTDRTFVTSFIEPMLAAERLLLQRSEGVLAISRAIATEVQQGYTVDFDDKHLAIVPIGLEDWAELDCEVVETLPEGALRVLFVGRLEERKGIDVFLDAITQIMPLYPRVLVDIVGNDQLLNQAGATYRCSFADDPAADAIRERVRFHGEVPDAALRGFYRACDIFVAPSRFESFGLILLEAMMFAKPVIGCRAGGMGEIVEDGESGLLAEPGDAVSLATACAG
jgi:glycogen(starch) synthase